MPKESTYSHRLTDRYQYYGLETAVTAQEIARNALAIRRGAFYSTMRNRELAQPHYVNASLEQLLLLANFFPAPDSPPSFQEWDALFASKKLSSLLPIWTDWLRQNPKVSALFDHIKMPKLRKKKIQAALYSSHYHKETQELALNVREFAFRLAKIALPIIQSQLDSQYRAFFEHPAIAEYAQDSTLGSVAKKINPVWLSIVCETIDPHYQVQRQEHIVDMLHTRALENITQILASTHNVWCTHFYTLISSFQDSSVVLSEFDRHQLNMYLQSSSPTTGVLENFAQKGDYKQDDILSYLERYGLFLNLQQGESTLISFLKDAVYTQGSKSAANITEAVIASGETALIEQMPHILGSCGKALWTHAPEIGVGLITLAALLGPSQAPKKRWDLEVQEHIKTIPRSHSPLKKFIIYHFSRFIVAYARSELALHKRLPPHLETPLYREALLQKQTKEYCKLDFHISEPALASASVCTDRLNSEIEATLTISQEGASCDDVTLGENLYKDDLFPVGTLVDDPYDEDMVDEFPVSKTYHVSWSPVCSIQPIQAILDQPLQTRRGDLPAAHLPTVQYLDPTTLTFQDIAKSSGLPESWLKHLTRGYENPISEAVQVLIKCRKSPQDHHRILTQNELRRTIQEYNARWGQSLREQIAVWSKALKRGYPIPPLLVAPHLTDSSLIQKEKGPASNMLSSHHTGLALTGQALDLLAALEFLKDPLYSCNRRNHLIDRSLRYLLQNKNGWQGKFLPDKRLPLVSQSFKFSDYASVFRHFSRHPSDWVAIAKVCSLSEWIDLVGALEEQHSYKTDFDKLFQLLLKALIQEGKSPCADRSLEGKILLWPRNWEEDAVSIPDFLRLVQTYHYDLAKTYMRNSILWAQDSESSKEQLNNLLTRHGQINMARTVMDMAISRRVDSATGRSLRTRSLRHSTTSKESHYLYMALIGRDVSMVDIRTVQFNNYSLMSSLALFMHAVLWRKSRLMRHMVSADPRLRQELANPESLANKWLDKWADRIYQNQSPQKRSALHWWIFENRIMQQQRLTEEQKQQVLEYMKQAFQICDLNLVKKIEVFLRTTDSVARSGFWAIGFATARPPIARLKMGLEALAEAPWDMRNLLFARDIILYYDARHFATHFRSYLLLARESWPQGREILYRPKCSQKRQAQLQKKIAKQAQSGDGACIQAPSYSTQEETISRSKTSLFRNYVVSHYIHQEAHRQQAHHLEIKKAELPGVEATDRSIQRGPKKSDRTHRPILPEVLRNEWSEQAMEWLNWAMTTDRPYIVKHLLDHLFYMRSSLKAYRNSIGDICDWILAKGSSGYIDIFTTWIVSENWSVEQWGRIAIGAIAQRHPAMYEYAKNEIPPIIEEIEDKSLTDIHVAIENALEVANDQDRNRRPLLLSKKTYPIPERLTAPLAPVNRSQWGGCC